MKICTYLNFRGQAREVMAFYGEIFRSKSTVLTYGEIPGVYEAMNLPEGMEDMVAHGELLLEKDQIIMISDEVQPDVGDTIGNMVSLVMMFEDEAELRRIFSELSVGGKEVIPLGETFWSNCFGCLKDRYGVTWCLNLSKDPEQVK